MGATLLTRRGKVGGRGRGQQEALACLAQPKGSNRLSAKRVRPRFKPYPKIIRNRPACAPTAMRIRISRVRVPMDVADLLDQAGDAVNKNAVQHRLYRKMRAAASDFRLLQPGQRTLARRVRPPHADTDLACARSDG